VRNEGLVVAHVEEAPEVPPLVIAGGGGGGWVGIGVPEILRLLHGNILERFFVDGEHLTPVPSLLGRQGLVAQASLLPHFDQAANPIGLLEVGVGLDQKA